jgi:hypothetical protein
MFVPSSTTMIHANTQCRVAEGPVVVSLPELREEAQAAYALASWLPEHLYSRPPDAVKALHNAGDPKHWSGQMHDRRRI